MTQRTGNEVPKEIVQIKLEEEVVSTMVVETFALKFATMIGQTIL